MKTTGAYRGSLFCALVCLLAQAPSFAQAATDPVQQSELKANSARLEREAVRRGLVSLEVSYQGWDWNEPWRKFRPRTRRGSGIVLHGGRILTTASIVRNHTLVELRRLDEQTPWVGRIERVDHVANLAIVTPEDPAFFEGLSAIPWGGRPPDPQLQTKVSVFRFDSDRRLESHAGTLVEVAAMRTGFGWPQLLSSGVICGIEGGGHSEPVLEDGALVGLTFKQSNDRVYAVSTPVLRAWLGDGADGKPSRGFGALGVRWQWLTNTELRTELNVPEEREGILINEVRPYSTGGGALRADDVLLSIGGENIDPRGNVHHEEYGPQPFAWLLTKDRFAGDEIEAEVVRDGKVLQLQLKIAPDDDAARLVPTSYHDKPPRYLVYSGLVFQELSVPYLRTYGSGWRKSAPLRLGIEATLKGASVDPQRRRIIVLSRVLADAATLGYEQVRSRRIDRINGRRIESLEDVAAALESPQSGFHLVEFMRDYNGNRLVLDAKEAAEAHPRILRQYGIRSERNLESSW